MHHYCAGTMMTVSRRDLFSVCWRGIFTPPKIFMARWRVYFTHKLCQQSIPVVVRTARSDLGLSLRARAHRIKERRRWRFCSSTNTSSSCESRRQTRRERACNLHLCRSLSQEKQPGMVLWPLDHELLSPAPKTLSSPWRDKSLFSK